MGVMVWDTTRMERRVATQQDIDELELIRSAYARILARFQEDRGMLLEDIKKLRSKAGMPNDLMVDPAREAPVQEETDGKTD